MPDDSSLTVTRKTCPVCKKDFFTSVGVCPTCGETNLQEVKRDAFIGRTIANRYQIESLIGTGGMGVVYKAWQESLKRAVAVKVLRHQYLNDELSVKRFQQEAIAASRLKHPNIVALHDFGTTEDGYMYMIMDIIEGKSLAQEARERGGSLGVDRTINIMTQVCDALEHAHRNGVVHRDLKPGNIMLTRMQDQNDVVKLVDFGIAKLLENEDDQELTQKGDVFGSPLYMSPEQCLGNELDGRSDIYSVGTVLYESLTGHVPHKGKNSIETIDKQIHAQAPSFASVRPDIYIPERLEAVVMKSLAKNPLSRQQSMRELSSELQTSVPRKSDTLNLRARIEPAKENSYRTKVIAGVLTVILCAGIGVGAFIISRTSKSSAPNTTPLQNSADDRTPSKGNTSSIPNGDEKPSPERDASKTYNSSEDSSELRTHAAPRTETSAKQATPNEPKMTRHEMHPNEVHPNETHPNETHPNEISQPTMHQHETAHVQHPTNNKSPRPPVPHQKRQVVASHAQLTPKKPVKESSPWDSLERQITNPKTSNASSKAKSATPWSKLENQLETAH